MARQSEPDLNDDSSPNLNDPDALAEFILGAIAGIALLALIGWTCGFLG